MPVRRDSDGPIVRLEEPGDFISALPGLLGHYPVTSLVTAHVRDDRLIRLACAELRAADLLDASVKLVGTVQPDSVVLVAVDRGIDRGSGSEDHGSGRLTADSLPYDSLVLPLYAALENIGVRISQALWAPQISLGSSWASYTNSQLCGTLPDPALAIPVRVAAALGTSIYPRRPANADDAVPDLIDDKRAAAIQRSKFINRQMTLPVRLARVDKAVTTAVSGHYPHTNLSLGLLAAALTDRQVRDTILLSTIRQNQLDTSQTLWTLLTRITPAPQQTWPATLLGTTAYIRGKHALAATALHVALQADENHELARLILNSIAIGMDPNEVEWLED